MLSERAIRFDMLERLEDELENALSSGAEAETLLTKLVSLLGSSKEEARAVLSALGWRSVEVAGANPVWRRTSGKAAPHGAGAQTRAAAKSSLALCGLGRVTHPMSRLDKWLFHARFYRTRPLAQAAATAGRVRLNGVKVDRPGHALKPGDVLTLGKGGQVIAVKVLALAEKRGPAAEARSLYQVLE